MTQIQNPKQKKTIALNRFGIYNLRFIWNLVLGICDFIQQTPRQSRITLTPAMRDRLGPSKIPFRGEGPGFSGQNKNMHYPRLIKY
jgi:hypothetical protein